jgi:hypothetical protein
MATGYVFSGPVESFNAAEVERSDAEVVEATLRWQGDVLETKHFAAGKAITVGETDACDFMVPANALGSNWAEIVGASSAAGATLVRAPANASMVVDGSMQDARELLDLRAGHACTLAFGEFSLDLRVVPAGKKTAAGFLESIRESALGSVGASAMMHAAIFASLALFLPRLSSDDAESIDRDRIDMMGKLLTSAAERERERDVSQDRPDTGSSGQAGGQTAGEQGATGTPLAHTQAHLSVQGDKQEISLPREKQLELARNFGMNDLLGTLATQINAGPSIPWGDVAAGADKETHLGNMWSPEIGDAFGSGWGLSGTGEGGGCQGGPCTGIGMNGISGLGIGIGKCDNPPCDGLGHGTGHGKLPGTYVPKGQVIRWAKEIDVNGRIPQEVIQRIVRQNAGRFRNCYETGLRTNPSLTGRVAVRFIIGRDGDVSMSSDSEQSDIPDTGVRACVVKSFYGISFPAPQGGTVKVTYPLMFTPSE